jgi:hypothetical protein
MAFTLYDGQAAWDRAGKLSSQGFTNVSPNLEPRYDVAWMDDAVPYMADTNGVGGDSWRWISTNPAPFAGTLAHQSTGSGIQEHSFNHAWVTMSVRTGDVLFSYVYLNPTNTPREVMLQWTDGTWDHRAYWGNNDIPYGSDETASRFNAGPLPAAGQWVRLEVPAKSVGLEGSTIKGMSFALSGGQATWDYAGRSAPLTLATSTNAYGMLLNWNTQLGATYRVQYKDSFSQGSWNSFGWSLTGTAATVWWLDSSARSTSQRFYRIVVQ